MWLDQPLNQGHLNVRNENMVVKIAKKIEYQAVGEVESQMSTVVTTKKAVMLLEWDPGTLADGIVRKAAKNRGISGNATA